MKSFVRFRQVLAVALMAVIITGCGVKLPQLPNPFNKEKQVEAPVATTEAAVETPVETVDLFKGQLASFVDPYPLMVIEAGATAGFEFADESAKDADLSDFIKKLKIATSERNKEKLLSLMDDSVLYLPNVTGSKDGFIRYWDLDQSQENRNLWLSLEKMLIWGGRMDGADSYVIPSLYKSYPDQDIVIQSHVNMRELPDTASGVVNQYSYAFVTVMNNKTGKTYDLDGKTYPWMGVKAEDGSEGYMVGAFIYGVDDFHIVVKHTQDGWKIVTFAKNKV